MRCPGQLCAASVEQLASSVSLNVKAGRGVITPCRLDSPPGPMSASRRDRVVVLTQLKKGEWAAPLLANRYFGQEKTSAPPWVE